MSFLRPMLTRSTLQSSTSRKTWPSSPICKLSALPMSCGVVAVVVVVGVCWCLWWCWWWRWWCSPCALATALGLSRLSSESAYVTLGKACSALFSRGHPQPTVATSHSERSCQPCSSHTHQNARTHAYTHTHTHAHGTRIRSNEAAVLYNLQDRFASNLIHVS
jgi:hypothetical protein